MISSVLALVAVLGGGQSDPTRTSREAFANCLRTYVERSIQDRMAADRFESEYPQQCTAQETAYRDAVIRGFRGSRADAEELAGLEIEDARTSYREVFAMESEETDRRQRAANEQATAQQAAQQTEQPEQPAEEPQPPPSR